MFGFAFAVVSPVILPVAWFFFLTAFLTYRYALLYVYERSYESGAWAPGYQDRYCYARRTVRGIEERGASVLPFRATIMCGVGQRRAQVGTERALVGAGRARLIRGPMPLVQQYMGTALASRCRNKGAHAWPFVRITPHDALARAAAAHPRPNGARRDAVNVCNCAVHCRGVHHCALSSFRTVPHGRCPVCAGGRMWPIVFDQVMGMMIIFEVFTGAVLLTNRAWVLSVVLWVTLTPALLVSEHPFAGRMHAYTTSRAAA